MSIRLHWWMFYVWCAATLAMLNWTLRAVPPRHVRSKYSHWVQVGALIPLVVAWRRYVEVIEQPIFDRYRKRVWIIVAYIFVSMAVVKGYAMYVGQRADGGMQNRAAETLGAWPSPRVREGLLLVPPSVVCTPTLVVFAWIRPRASHVIPTARDYSRRSVRMAATTLGQTVFEVVCLRTGTRVVESMILV